MKNALIVIALIVIAGQIALQFKPDDLHRSANSPVAKKMLTVKENSPESYQQMIDDGLINLDGSIPDINALAKALEYEKENPEDERHSSLNALLMEASNSLNENLPRMVDKSTRLDNTLGVSGKFFYNYTLVDAAASEFDIPALEKAMRPIVINGACSSTEMKLIFQDGVTVIYNYRGNDGVFMIKYTVTPSECGY